MNHQELKEYLDNSDWRSETRSFYSVLKSSIRDEIDAIESDIDATINPPNVCVFTPAEFIKDSLSSFASINRVSDAEVLAGMSLFLGYTSVSPGSDYHGMIDKELAEAFFYFNEEYQDHKLTKIAGFFNQIERNDKGLHKSLARFFPAENYIALNYFTEETLPENVPDLLVPARNFLLYRESRYVRSTVTHEMTHAYIENKAKFKNRTTAINSLDEAAGNTVENFFKKDHVPGSSYYYKEYIDQDVMQAARNVFLELAKGKDMPEGVSLIRRKAVKAINKVVDGEDPVKALREENDRRSRILRIVSYATKNISDNTIRDLAIVGITKPYTKFADVEQTHNRTQELDEIWGDLAKVGSSGRNLHELVREGKIRKRLREPTEKLSEDAEKINKLVKQSYEDEIEADVSFLNDLFGESIYTEPAIYTEDEMVRQTYTLLYRYKNLVEEAVSRARKLESATETIHEEGGKLIRRYENQRAEKNVKLIIEETEKLHKEINEVRENLEEAEKMAEIGLEKIEELRETM